MKEPGGTPSLGEFDEPEDDDDGVVVVEVSVAGMNPVDIATAAGIMGERPIPSVVGREGIGIRDGKRYYFEATVDPHGSFAERTLVDPDDLIEVPDGVDDGLAVSFGIAGLAAWLSLEWRAELKRGESVLVLGASGVVGQIGVQAAKLLGAGRVVAAARNEEMLELASELGADATVNIDADRDEVQKRLAAEAGDAGYDVILDPLWGDPAAVALKSIASFGRLVQIGNSAGTESELTARDLRSKPAAILGHMNFTVPHEVKTKAFQQMCRHGAAGELRVEVEELGLEQVEDAWKRQKEGPHHKLVIRP